jgi:hypothetical protein
MPALAVARRHAATRDRVIGNVRQEARRAWQRVNPAAVNATWLAQLPRMLLAVAGAQLLSAASSALYLDRVLAEQGLDPTAVGAVNARALAGIASDGRPLDTLLMQPMFTTLAALGAGMQEARALAGGYATLDMIVRTQIADAGRVADELATAVRPAAQGYVRMVSPGACARCAILAGRWYRWDAGFLRHPSCNCVGIPSAEDRAGDLFTDPRAYFDSLSPEEQDRIFTTSGAEAIRLGADMSQVVNARRGMQSSVVFGREIQHTLEGITRRGVAGSRLIAEGARLQGIQAETVTRTSRSGPVERQVIRQRVNIPRLMPEQILADATGRDAAIRLLRRFGYIT